MAQGEYKKFEVRDAKAAKICEVKILESKNCRDVSLKSYVSFLFKESDDFQVARGLVSYPNTR